MIENEEDRKHAQLHIGRTSTRETTEQVDLNQMKNASKKYLVEINIM